MIIISEHNQSPFRGFFSLPGSQAVHIPDDEMEKKDEKENVKYGEKNI
jgi:hypothetical protein